MDHLPTPEYLNEHAVEVDSVDAVVDDFEAFLRPWTDRMQALAGWLQQCGEREAAVARKEAALADWASELQTAQQQWSAHRDEEVEQLQQQVEELTSAWMRLEREQRERLSQSERSGVRLRSGPPLNDPGANPSAARVGSDHDSSSSVNDPAPPRVDPELSKRRDGTPTREHLPVSIPTSAVTIGDAGDETQRSQRAAHQQFAQLQREIRFDRETRP